MSTCGDCGKEPRYFPDWDECSTCGGSGKDDASWDGRCFHCHGRGEVDYGGFECDCDLEDRL